MTRFRIGDREVGDGCPVFIVMEVAQAHDGSLGTALKFIDVAAVAGADAVKFQTHIADAESTIREPFRVKFSTQDMSRYDYWKRMEFTEEQWQELADHAAERGLIFLSSPFSVEAVDLLERVGVPAWKVGSGEVANIILLERIIETGKPILLSSGMSSWEELDGAVARVKDAGVPVMVYQCTTAYPCPPEKLGLAMLEEMRERYGVPVGLSDHSGKVYAGIAAVALGAASVEVHLCLSRDDTSPDVPASLTPEETGQLVEGIRAVEADLGTPVDKDQIAEDLRELKRIFGRSIVAKVPLAKGTVLTREHVTVKKPADGLPPSALDSVIGRRLRWDMAADDLITEADLESA